jgi:methyl-accepting chemotaxis protein
MFKNLKIGNKLGLGFGLVLVLLAGLSWYNYSSFQSIAEMAEITKEAADNRAFAIEKEVDHLKWMSALSDLFLSHTVTEVAVQTDDHKCGLGKWVYSEETRQMCAEDPELAAIVEKIKEPHLRLHSSAIAIGEEYVDFDDELKSLLAERWIDHLNWIKQVANSNLSNTEFDGGLDPHKCAFGKWYYSYQPEDPTFGTLLEKWEDPHTKLHESAQNMVAAQQSGNWNEAQKIYHEQTIPTLARLEECYNGTLQWINNSTEAQERAHEIYEQETRVAVAETQGHLAGLMEYFDSQSMNASDEANENIASAIMFIFVLSGIAIILGLGAAWMITRSIVVPIRKVVKATDAMNQGMIEMEEVVEAIAANDLTKDISETEMEKIGIDSKDEIGQLVTSIEDSLASKDRMSISMRRMSANLNNMVRQLSDNARDLVSAATEIASSSEQMSRGAKDQTDQVTQVSSAVEEMTATIVESSKNAGEASDSARGAADTAGTGGEIVNETISGMQSIAKVVRESAESIGKLAKSAEQIGEIIGVIDDIADQTNLLALNAAMEAARAGEQGRGFAVVADEVRKLAERTGKATGEITEMIKGIQSETSDAVGSMETGIEEVDKGRELADKAGNSLSEVVNMSQRVMDMIQQIATATEEQSSAAEQISKNIESVASISKESAIGAGQSAAAAEQLNHQAEGLRTMVSNFKVRGGNTGIVELAKQDHALYIKKLDAVVRHPDKANDWKSVDHKNCRFGKWYYSSATDDLRSDTAYRNIEAPHMRVHEAANKAVDALKAGQSDQGAQLRDRAHQASEDVIAKLGDLAEHMSQAV